MLRSGGPHGGLDVGIVSKDLVVEGGWMSLRSLLIYAEG
jgi:hypothetical protein